MQSIDPISFHTTGAVTSALAILGRWSPANYYFIHIYHIHHVSKFMHACPKRATPSPHLVVHRLYDWCRTRRQISSNVRCVYVSVVSYYTTLKIDCENTTHDTLRPILVTQTNIHRFVMLIIGKLVFW